MLHIYAHRIPSPVTQDIREFTVRHVCTAIFLCVQRIIAYLDNGAATKNFVASISDLECPMITTDPKVPAGFDTRAGEV